MPCAAQILLTTYRRLTDRQPPATSTGTRRVLLPTCQAVPAEATQVAGCRSVAAFQHVLMVRISQLLITQLQILLDPACEPAAQANVLRIVLRVTRTTLQQFHRQLGAKTGVLLEGLLSGLSLVCLK